MTTPTFLSLGVPARVNDALIAMERPTPFPIQVATLPDALAGRDVLGRGKTGSGKTLAFAIPLVARLAGQLAGGRRRGGLPLGLVLAPTRELATQITRTIEPLASAVGLTVTTIFGGVRQGPQEQALARGVDIVVACPGRLDDLMKQRIASLEAIEITVIDEADHMADLGFLPVVSRILDATPKGGQRLLFSATLDNGVDKLVHRYLERPVMHSIDEATSPVAAMTHHVFEVEPDGKNALVRMLASGHGRRILFTRTKHQAKKLAKQLTASGIPAVDLHGNLSQNARDRNLASFSDGSVRVLVATDVAARGVHVEDVELVVHVDPPMEHKAYLHRSGRTARAGNEGDVATVMLPAQRRDTEQLLRKAAIGARPQRVTAGSDAVVGLVGDIAPHVAPVPGGPGAGNAPEQGGAPRRRSGAGQQAEGRGRGGQGRRDRSGRPEVKQQRRERTTGGTRGASENPRSGGASRGGSSRGGASSSRGGASVAWSSSGGGSMQSGQQRGAQSRSRRASRPQG